MSNSEDDRDSPPISQDEGTTLVVATERSEEILAAAAQLFSAHGYHGVGIRMIAKAVGVQTSTLYHYFASKEEILYQIALQATSGFIDAHTALLDSEGPSPVVLRILVEHHVAYFAAHRTAQEIANRELRELTPRHLEEIRHRQREYLDRIVSIVERGCERGELRVPNPPLVTRAFLDMLNNVNRWFVPREGMSTVSLGLLYSELIVDNMLRAKTTQS